MSGNQWSWVLTVLGITVLWMAGKWPRLGWGVGVWLQVLWIAMGIQTEQYGFCAMAVAYGVVYLRNWNRYRLTKDE